MIMHPVIGRVGIPGIGDIRGVSGITETEDAPLWARLYLSLWLLASVAESQNSESAGSESGRLRRIGGANAFSATNKAPYSS